MTAGAMKTRVTIQKSTQVIAADKSTRPGWSDDTPNAAVWCEWDLRDAAIAQRNLTSQATTIVKARIYYRAGVNVSKAVLKGGDRYRVLSVFDPGDNHQYMDLVLELIKGGT